MRVLLIRHGKAERDSRSGLDADRVLTERGVRQAEWLAGHLLKMDQRPSLLLTSPITRARQTAQSLARRLGLAAMVEPRLTTDVSPSDVLETIAELEGRRCVALVGHNPHFEETISLMLHGIGEGRGVRLRTGEAFVLDVGDPVDPVGRSSLVEVLRLDEEMGVEMRPVD